MIFSSDLTIWVRWVSQIHRKRSTQYCELGWGSLHYLWIWEGRKKEKRSSYTSLSTDTQCCFLQLRYFPAIIAFLKMPSWITKMFVQLSSLHHKHCHQNPQTLFLVFIPIDFPLCGKNITKRSPKISNYKIFRMIIWFGLQTMPNENLNFFIFFLFPLNSTLLEENRGCANCFSAGTNNL